VAAVDPGGSSYVGQVVTLGSKILFTGDDGVYGQEVWSGGATSGLTPAPSPGGNPLRWDVSFDFFVLAGDADRDRTVGPADFNLLASHFGQRGQGWFTGDFDGDGTVGPGDFNLLASNFGRAGGNGLAGDLNFDGAVGPGDFNLLASNFGSSLSAVQASGAVIAQHLQQPTKVRAAERALPAVPAAPERTVPARRRAAGVS
jgi:hypothetical protein